ncbi:TetR/AcrR family transcriptional regulator [Streptomyces sp. 142MFCol3.1]|uniref:TetR/AcrR family transcriptional regulator n=1 Tax=Streptomyces sp. 142MFCol3.1 TaxID=1172179 RepID=UPI0004086015|nr:TetR/AcrR family transcriptional regulator [Streptomyces sp. 142MFCol3.1]
MATGSRTGTGPRDRFRAQVRQEVKTAALAQLAEGGPEALSLNAVAKQLGMTGPALYRYFANRDSLLTELVVDAYGDLAVALSRAAGHEAKGPGSGPHDTGAGRTTGTTRLDGATDAGRTTGTGTSGAKDSDAVARLAAIARAYRAWALAEPHRYRLLFRAPLQGYDAQSTSLVEASQPAMNVVLDAVNGLTQPDSPAPEGPAAQFRQWMERHGIEGVPEAVAARATILWARLHGLVSLEIEGNFASMGIDPATLYDAEMKDFTSTRTYAPRTGE